MPNKLFYGDNLEILRSRKMKDESVDLCYIDPPFNSKRTYNQIYNNLGKEDKAQAQAFVDTWTWDERASAGFHEIETNNSQLFPREAIELFSGFRRVLGESSLLAYLTSIALRVSEIHRVLKPKGNFFLHCDPTSSHYLKLVIDSIFCPQGGDFRNELVWCYTGPGSPGMRQFMRKHDTIFWYSKDSSDWTFNRDAIRIAHSSKTKANYKKGLIGSGFVGADHLIHESGKVPEDWWQIAIAPRGKEYLGYPTQKPESLLRRIISAASNEGDTVLDAYCGCGTSVAVAHELNRRWIGMDITYQSISLILKRLERDFGADSVSLVSLDGIPQDFESAVALANKKDDRLRKEFEKWAILTYTSNRAIVNEKKGADGGVDGIAYILTGGNESIRMLLQVKSGSVERGDVAKLRGDMVREKAQLGTLLSLQEPTSAMKKEAKSGTRYLHELTGIEVPEIELVTVRQIIEKQQRLRLPVSLEALWKAKETGSQGQLGFSFISERSHEKRPSVGTSLVPARRAIG
jgi:DNA modification methylase